MRSFGFLYGDLLARRLLALSALWSRRLKPAKVAGEAKEN